MPVLNFESYSPEIGERIFLAPDAWVIGKAQIGDDVSIFFGAVLRGDINHVRVGRGTNIQEHAVLHTSQGLGDVVVGEDVTVGHHAILHGCKVNDRCIIGMNSTVLDQAEIGQDSIVGANSLVTMGKIFPERSLIIGSPARRIRELSQEEILSISLSAARYREKGASYRDNLKQA